MSRENRAGGQGATAWPVLVVASDPALHDAAIAALDGVRHDGRPLRLVHARSAGQGRRLLKAMSEVAVCLIDIAEADDGGVALVRHIRNDLGNRAARILVRGPLESLPDSADLVGLDIDVVCAEGRTVTLAAQVRAALRAYDRMVELLAARINLTRLNHEVEQRIRDRTRDLTANHQRVESILDAVLFPILISRQGDLMVRYANRRVGELFGSPVEDVLEGRMPDVFDDPRDCDQILRLLDHLGRFDDQEIRLRRADGTAFWALMSGTVMEYAGQRCILATFNDISERKAMEIELQRLATTDELTGASSRRHFLGIAAQELRRSRRFGHPLSVVVFDIDHFKAVNDTHGHAAGDTVLRTVSDVVRRVLREVDTFGRIGGEEFAVVLPETEMLQAIMVAERLRRAIGGTATGVAGVGPVTISIGVAALADQDEGVQDIMERADSALYRAKRQGRNRVEQAE